MGIIKQLRELRDFGGKPRTTGLDDATIERMAARDPLLGRAVAEAVARHQELRADLADFLKLDEAEQLARAQAGFVNFYPDDATNPYLPAAARGPWIVTLKGAVLHDSGGYGMLGFGHNDQAILDALARPQVMANVMSPSVAQLRFTAAMNKELGRHRGGSPYHHYMCLNSGSESVSLACRIADVNAKAMTDTGGRYAGRAIKRLAVKGAFHGRTDKPALYSDSSRKVYQQHLASYRHEDSVITVAPYDVGQLEAVFADADKHGWFMEAMSKALNAGQYPLSVLAVTDATAKLYRKGIYGNTMTANPRALDVALATLGELSDEVRDNIRERGREFLDKLNALKNELGGLITKVQGTGLLFSCELAPEYKCYGADSTEEFMREHGIGVIHGGANSLRFTPHFRVTSAEVDLIIAHVRRALLEGPRKAKAEAA